VLPDPKRGQTREGSIKPLVRARWEGTDVVPATIEVKLFWGKRRAICARKDPAGSKTKE